MGNVYEYNLRFFPYMSEGKSAHTHTDSGNSLCKLFAAKTLPKDCQVGMSVNIDKTGRYHTPGGIDDSGVFAIYGWCYVADAIA